MTSAPNRKNPFERAVLVISLDTEQIWGHFDRLDEDRFNARYPDALGVADRVLECLCAAKVSATWAIVGALALDGMAGPGDPRLAGLPRSWTARVRAGTEASAPLWYRRSFVRRLAEACPAQEVGLHGGLTHLIWTDRRWNAGVVERELAAGLEALREACIFPRSFVFTRNEEAHHELLLKHGLQCYRGLAPVLSDRLGHSLAGALSRVVDELGCRTPPPVWPEETLPGLWRIPASLWIYPMGKHRSKVVPLRTRLERVRRGIAAATRHRGMFHLCLHPENLAESPLGLPVFEAIVEMIGRARDAGDAEVLTMSEVTARMAARQSDGVASLTGISGRKGAAPVPMRIARRRGA